LWVRSLPNSPRFLCAANWVCSTGCMKISIAMKNRTAKPSKHPLCLAQQWKNKLCRSIRQFVKCVLEQGRLVFCVAINSLCTAFSPHNVLFKVALRQYVSLYTIRGFATIRLLSERLIRRQVLRSWAFDCIVIQNRQAMRSWDLGHSIVSSSRTGRPCAQWGGRWIGQWRITWSTVCSSASHGTVCYRQCRSFCAEVQQVGCARGWEDCPLV